MPCQIHRPYTLSIHSINTSTQYTRSIQLINQHILAAFLTKTDPINPLSNTNRQPPYHPPCKPIYQACWVEAFYLPPLPATTIAMAGVTASPCSPRLRNSNNKHQVTEKALLPLTLAHPNPCPFTPSLSYPLSLISHPLLSNPLSSLTASLLLSYLLLSLLLSLSSNTHYDILW